MNFRRKATDQVAGFLDQGTTMTGELEFSGILRIDGTFHGSIATNDCLIIGEHARVHADVKAGEVEVHGQVFGSIVCTRRVEVSPTGRVHGDVETPVLVIDAGAKIDGRTRMGVEKPEEKPEETTTVGDSADAHATSREESF
jgi:cytoskeletal protein CcmA (bactofilin family)